MSTRKNSSLKYMQNSVFCCTESTENRYIPDDTKVLLLELAPELLDILSEAMFDLENSQDLHNWLENINDQQ